jgi:hypothetical protein
MAILVLASSWLLIVSILILAVANGMSLRALREQGTSRKELVSRWLAQPATWTFVVLVMVLLGLALWMRAQADLSISTAAIQGASGLVRAILLLGALILVLGVSGFFFSDPTPDR